MSQLQRIKKTIDSTKKTTKITNAMMLVSTSKLGKAQQKMQKSRPFADKITETLGHFVATEESFEHPFLTKPDQIDAVGLIVISTDKGLCGSLNQVIFKQVLQTMQDYQQQNIACPMAIIGKKGYNFFKKLDTNIVAHAQNLSPHPTINEIGEVIYQMIARYQQQQIQKVLIFSNQFITTLTQSPRIKTLLPIQSFPASSDEYRCQYYYEPNRQEVVNGLLKSYIESVIYQALTENIACEHAARMIAMKNATDNAENIINELQLAYNKARQANITKEISEIVSGADALG